MSSPLFWTHQNMAIRLDNLVRKLALGQRASAYGELFIAKNRKSLTKTPIIRMFIRDIALELPRR